MSVPFSPTPPQLNPNCLKVLEKRYLKKNSDGKPIESPTELFMRVAENVADADIPGQAEAFYKMMTSLEFLPNSPTLINAGRDLQQLSACFVLPVGDSIEDIFDAIKHMALIHKSGGGTGFSFSRLRPEGSMVQTTHGVSSGPVSFMRVFNSATEVIKQGGVRRGANMGILRVDHPDIMKFIQSKSHQKEFTNFNISVALTDAFMEAVQNEGLYDLIEPHSGKPIGKLVAKDVFDSIVEEAWHNGEPGIVFLDEINRHNPTPHIGAMEATNPCGEQPLLPYEACNLGSVNLSRFVTGKMSDAFAERAIDFARLSECVKMAVRFLDQVIDRSRFPMPEIDEMVRGNRKIGLGVMGFADLLFQLGVPYNSERAISLADEIMGFIKTTADEASRLLAEEKGAYPNHPGSRHQKEGQSFRNATRTTIAPTGTLSIIAGCSSGIEPVFALAFARHILDKKELYEANPIFEKIARERGFYSEELMAEVSAKGVLADIDDIPPEIKKIFVTAHDISPQWHTRIQAAFQKHVDNAVSKTVNFPHNATREDVREVFLTAYKMKLKGITIYRDGSRDSQVLQVGSGGEPPKKENIQEPKIADKTVSEPEYLNPHIKSSPRTRPDVTLGITRKIPTGCGSIYVTLNEDEDGPCEVFVRTGKSGGCVASFAEGIGRLISVALRAGVRPEAIIKQIKNVRCPNPTWCNGGQIFSCSDAIGKVMADFLEESERYNFSPVKLKEPAGICPDCGSTLEFSEGCCKCLHCGYTKC